MAEIDPRYASPNLRWSLLLKDHPGAEYDFELWEGAQLNLPAEFGRDRKYCVCIITLPKHPDEVAQRKPIIGWKSISASELTKGDPEVWNVLCTKTLGRALKRAGYPDHLPDLKALLLWYQRKAEIGRIASGLPPLELGTGETMDKSLDEAAQRHGDDDEHVGDDDIAEAEVIPPDVPPPGTARPPALTDIEARVNQLPREMQQQVRDKLRERGATWERPGRAVEALVVALEEKAGRKAALEAPFDDAPPAAQQDQPTPTPEAAQEAPAASAGEAGADGDKQVPTAVVEGVLAITGEWPPPVQRRFGETLEKAGIPPLGPWTVSQLAVAEAHLDGIDAEVRAGATK
jgi:hypothetical protein